MLFAGGGSSQQTIVVCRLPADIVAAIDCSTDELRIKDYYANKLRLKHNISPREFCLIPSIVQSGEYLRLEGGKLLAHYQTADGVWYELCVKSTRRKNELWITSFHRSDKSKVDRKQWRYNVIPRQYDRGR
jgi:hypothetical protein